MSRVYRTSKPDHSVVPRAHTDAHQRYRTYGAVRSDQSEREARLRKVVAIVKLAGIGVIGAVCFYGVGLASAVLP